MASTVLSIRTDTKTKNDVAEFASSLGLSVSALTTVLLKQAILAGQVTLKPLEPTPRLAKTMRKARTDYKTGKNVTHYKNESQALEHLRSL